MSHDGIFVNTGIELVDLLCDIVSDCSGFISFGNELLGIDLVILRIEGRQNLNEVLVDVASGGILDLIHSLALVHRKEEIY